MPCQNRTNFNLDRYSQIGQRIAVMLDGRTRFDADRYDELIKEIHALVGEARIRKEDHAHREHPEAASVPPGWERHAPDAAGDYLRRYSTAMAVAPRAWAGWTDDEEEALVDAYHAGETLRSIAVRHQRKLNAIRSRLQHLGLPPDRSRLDASSGSHNQWITAARGSQEVTN